MLFDIKRIKFHSLKDFLKEYLMIVIGILTALALEHAVVARNHVHAAEQSRQRIVSEIRTNLSEVRSAREKNNEFLKSVAKISSELKADITKGVSKNEVNKLLLKRLNGTFSISYVWPSLRHEAWDVVVANQSASYLQPETLGRFSAAYAAQRDSATLGLQSSTALFNGSRLLDAITDLELQRVDPIEFLKVLAGLSASINSLQSNVIELQTQLENALVGE